MFLIENALEILYLCLGVGFLMMSFSITRAVIRLNRILTKIDDLTDIFIEYIQKPLSFILQAHKTIQKIRNFF